MCISIYTYIDFLILSEIFHLFARYHQRALSQQNIQIMRNQTSLYFIDATQISLQVISDLVIQIKTFIRSTVYLQVAQIKSIFFRYTFFYEKENCRAHYLSQIVIRISLICIDFRSFEKVLSVWRNLDPVRIAAFYCFYYMFSLKTHKKRCKRKSKVLSSGKSMEDIPHKTVIARSQFWICFMSLLHLVVENNS